MRVPASGTVLEEWAALSELRYLDASLNFLTGKLPAALGTNGALPELSFMALPFNRLTGGPEI